MEQPKKIKMSLYVTDEQYFKLGYISARKRTRVNEIIQKAIDAHIKTYENLVLKGKIE